MRAIEWETKGVSRMQNPSPAATLQWPFQQADNHPHSEAGGRMPGKTAADGSEERRETKP